MSATIRQIVTDAQVIVGEVSGSGSQTYGEDRMKADCIRAFNMMFKKYFWHQYRKWYRLELDGVLGVVTTDAFEKVLDFEDFAVVTRDGETRPLPVLGKETNPFIVNTTGGLVRYWTALNANDANYVKRKLQFYPVTAIGFVNIMAREYPLDTLATNWDWEDIMELDRDMLAAATAFMTLSGDDLNPTGLNTSKQMMETKYRDVQAALAKQPIIIKGDPGIPTTWYTRP